jgi:T5SS/PEP-CTERM-associated repeat protein
MLKTDHKSLLLAALLCSAAFLNQAALAADWNAATGDWTNAANWTPAQVPTAGDTALIDNSGNAQVTDVQSAEAFNLFVGDVSSGNSLGVSNGGTVTVGHSVLIGNASTSSNNSVRLSDAGTFLTNGVDLSIGNDGSGNSLVISNGASAYVGRFTTVGNNAGSANNTLVVTDNAAFTNFYDLYIGNAGFSNSLEISGGGTVTVLGDPWPGNYNGSVIGSKSNSFNNSAVISGFGSTLNSPNLFVGDFGSSNSLTISNGGQALVAATTFLGNNASSSNNSVVVTGAASALSNGGDLVVGYYGSSNSLVISDGAQVADINGWLGYGASSSNNTVVVTDAGSLWTNSAGLIVGNDGSGNSLTISNGAQVTAATVALIGNNGGSSNNTAVVTGAGSVLSTSGELYVGNVGSFNSLVISDGGQVVNVNGWIGNNVSSSNNTVIVSDAGTLWTNQGGVIVGHDGSSNSLVISNGAQVFAATGAAIGNTPSSSNNMVVVTGADSTLTTPADLYVGSGGSFNSLVISDGGQVFNANGVIGNYAGVSNSVLITGPGSLWSNSGTVNIGPNVGGASLALEDGAQLVAASSIYVQPAATLSGNGTITTTDLNVLGGGTLSPTGTNSLVINGDLKVGPWSFWNGQRGSLLWSLDGNTNGPAGSTNFSAPITLNGALEVGYATFDINLGSNVSPSDGFWSNSATWTVINGTNPLTQGANFNMALSGNTNGFNIGAKIWEYSTNVNSFYLVTSGNSLQLLYSVGDFWTSGTNYWTNGGNWSRGLEPGSTTQPIIDNGGTAILETAGQAFNLFVGFTNSDNTLLVTNGGQLSVENLAYIGHGENSSNNSVVVTGPSSLLSSAGSGLAVGYLGSGNSLVISDGAKVLGGSPDQYFSSYIGYGSNSSGNSVLVTGANSLWSSSGDLYIGNEGSSNSLTVADGGTVANSYGYIGSYNTSYNTSSNNSVLVTGANSLWTNSQDIFVGLSLSDNSMVISNGGTVASVYGYIGSYDTSSNNSVLVTGANSLWTNSEEIYVGLFLGDNSMVISNGGTVANTYGYIGFFSTSSNNSVLVTGASSLWTNSGELHVGREGSGNSLTVADGGTVAASGIRIAALADSSGTLNIGRFGTNDAAGTIIAPTIAFGDGTGSINFNQSNAMTLSAIISGNGGVNQLGSGTTELSGISTYTGSTSVEAGKLVVSGSIAGSAVTVSGTGTLGGTGTVGSLTILDLGTLSPGDSPGNLNVAGNVTWNGGGNYNWQIYDTTLPAGTGWDLVTSGGALDLTSLTTANKFNLNLWSLSGIAPDADGDALNFDNTQNYTWTILTAATGINGFAADKFNINLGAANGTAGFANALGGGTFSLLTSGNNLNLMFTAAGGAAVPEPGTWAAAALLVGGAAFMRWRKRKQVS